MKTRHVVYLIASLFTLLSFGCGGGGGGGGGAAPAPATAGILKLSTAGTLATGNLIGAVDLTINLPAQVTVKATPDTNNPNILVVNQGVVTVSGVAAAAGGTTINIATYTPATATAPAQVRVVLANSAGFGLGEFLTINCDIAGGGPTSADFTVPAFSASGGPDLQTNLPLTGVTAVVSSFSPIVQ